MGRALARAQWPAGEAHTGLAPSDRAARPARLGARRLRGGNGSGLSGARPRRLVAIPDPLAHPSLALAGLLEGFPHCGVGGLPEVIVGAEDGAARSRSKAAAGVKRGVAHLPFLLTSLLLQFGDLGLDLVAIKPVRQPASHTRAVLGTAADRDFVDVDDLDHGGEVVRS